MNAIRFLPPKKQYEGYIFDCDGTLADTMPLHFQAWCVALRDAGASFDFTWQIFTSRAGMSIEATVEELARQFSCKLDPVVVAENHRKAFQRLAQKVSPVPGVLDFARRVASLAEVSVASGSKRESVLSTLTSIEAADLFSIVVTPELVPNGKPHPDLFLLAAEHMGVSPEKCLVIEDGEFGFEAARRAGMDYVVVEPSPPASPADG